MSETRLTQTELDSLIVDQSILVARIDMTRKGGVERFDREVKVLKALKQLKDLTSSKTHEDMWVQQREFMDLIVAERNFPQHPVDVTSKAGQQLIEKISFDVMKELFEAIQHLKNSKQHRITQITEFNRDDFKEEIVDALHYFIEVCILAGLTRQEVEDAYFEKGERNFERIRNGY